MISNNYSFFDNNNNNNDNHIKSKIDKMQQNT